MISSGKAAVVTASNIIPGITGQGSIGFSVSGAGITNNAMGQTFVATQSGVLEKFFINNLYAHSPDAPITFGLYADPSGSSSSLPAFYGSVAVSGSDVEGPGETIVDFSTLTLPIVAGNTYWMLMSAPAREGSAQYDIRGGASSYADGAVYVFRSFGSSKLIFDEGFGDTTFSATVSPVPEPGSAITLALGAVLFLGRRRR